MFIYLLIGSKDSCEAKQSELYEDGGTELDTETRESGGLNKNKKQGKCGSRSVRLHGLD